MRNLSNRFIRELFFCIFSAILFILAFPPFNWWFCAWFALVPLLITLDGKNKIQAFGRGYLTGMVFFAGTLYWFIHVTLPGMILIVLFLALYFGLFAAGYVPLKRQSVLVNLLVIPAWWITVEFARDKIFTGFGWVSLGHSQYQILPLIQMAEITGVAGISFLLVMVNYLVKELLISRDFRRVIWPITVVGLSLAAVVSYGFSCLNRSFPNPTMTIAVVQANVAQELKWQSGEWQEILEKYFALTRQVAATAHPDLIIWPETAFPGFPWESGADFNKLREFVTQLKIPLLFGSVTMRGERYYNSALLFSAKGEILTQYDKLHLVPFGEYIPLRGLFPFLEQIIPIGDFTAGKEFTLFSTTNSGPKLAALICFEDTLAPIARGFVRHGANVLVNITNDAWFWDTNEPFLHLQAAVFRTIETRRSLVRATNTGVSCFIDPVGKIYQVLQNPAGKQTFVEGVSVAKVALNDQPTFYTKFGDVFTYVCFGCILSLVIYRKYKIFQ